MRPKVDEVSDATHELLSAVVGMLAESTRLDPTAHARTKAAVADLAQRPREPQITDQEIVSGRWVARLVAHVAPHAGDLAALLGRAVPPNHPSLAGPSASERLEAALRVLDTEARSLERRIPEVARYQALPSIEDFNAANKARRERERVERALSKMAKTTTTTTTTGIPR
jgi:hypothetical protein